MTWLRSFAARLEVGDRIVLKGKMADVQNQTPKRVTQVEKREEEIRVEAEGPQGGTYAFRVERDGSHQAYYLPPGDDDEVQKRGPVETLKLVWTAEMAT